MSYSTMYYFAIQLRSRKMVCRLCHFVWFDAAEVENLVPRSVPPPKPELPQKAREAIALAKVQELAEQGSQVDLSIADGEERAAELEIEQVALGDHSQNPQQDHAAKRLGINRPPP